MDNPGRDRFEALAARAQSLRETHHIPGLAIGVGEGEASHSRGFGCTNVDDPQPVDTDTLFQIGSVTKTYTCALIMRLVETGQLELEAPVRRYLPEFALADETAAGEVTLLTLLSHMGGFEADLYVDTGGDDAALARALAHTRELEQLTPPESLWSYGNAGFYALGRIVERVTGESYEAALERLVLAPLGLRRTFTFSEQVATQRHCVGHLTSRGQTRVLQPWALPRASHSVLGISVTIDDLMAWLRSFNEARLLQAATLERLFTSNGQDTGQMSCRGAVSWATMPIAGERVVYHGGVTLGQQTRVLLIPARKLAFAVVGNSMRVAFAARELMDTWLCQHLGVGLDTPPAIPISADALAAYAGTYSRRGAHVRVTVEDGQLLIQSQLRQGFPDQNLPVMPPSRAQAFAPYARDRMRVMEGPRQDERADFYRDAAGEVTWVRLAMRLHRRRGSGGAKPEV